MVTVVLLFEAPFLIIILLVLCALLTLVRVGTINKEKMGESSLFLDLF